MGAEKWNIEYILFTANHKEGGIASLVKKKKIRRDISRHSINECK